jgi:hypothetical protein
MAIAQGGTAQAAAQLDVDARSLLIQGYNYTDDYIDSFTVDGQGGGNLYVSGPTSGGGGSVCCASFARGTSMPIRLKVRWTGGYCMWQEPNPYPIGQRFLRQASEPLERGRSPGRGSVQRQASCTGSPHLPRWPR